MAYPAITPPCLTGVGIWSLELRFGDPVEAGEAAAELDELGYSALWFPGGIGGDLLGDASRLLGATRKATIATGILNIWRHEPEEVAAWWLALPESQQERMLLGLGVSHEAQIGQAWGKPVATMRAYLDRLEAAGLPLKFAACLAALGPKMLELAATRTAGAHPYLITPEHTAEARSLLGPDAMLAPEQGVVLETDPARARELGRGALAHYARLPNYTNSWKRLGFSDDDIANVSDRLVDHVIAWGDPAAIAARVQAHFDGGANHVCVQVITGQGTSVSAPRAAWRELAAALI